MTKATPLSSSSSSSQQQQQQQQYVVNALEAKSGVHLLSPPPNSKRDVQLADCMGRFASFCLDDSETTTTNFHTITLPLLQEHLEDGLVGELQGGNEHASIYRVALPQQQPNNGGGDTGPVSKLFQAFLQVYPHYQSTLTIERLQEYMLRMCNDPRRQDPRTYSRLGNVMLILSHGRGPLLGQVRHIDHMDPNLQVCCYMSEACPATVLYDLEEPSITNCEELLDFWQEEQQRHGGDDVPTMIQNIMIEWQDVPLVTILTQHPQQLSFFHFWKSLNHHLHHFGKLYQRVSQVLAVQECTPGTTLIVRGNQVHAGPPSHTPRMFAFGIGIPDDDDDDDSEEEESDGHAASTTTATTTITTTTTTTTIADGEIQYNPVLLHVDLCCILFALMTIQERGGDKNSDGSDTTDGDTTIDDAKRYLLRMLPAMILEYPHETYARLLDDR